MDGIEQAWYTRQFWAKAQPYGQPGPESIHLLEHHLADVGACFEALLNIPTIRKRIAAAGGSDDLDAATVARLSLLAAFHDVGKVNVGFQTKIWRNEDFSGGRRKPGRAGHVADMVPVLMDKDQKTADWFFDSLGWWWEATESWDDRDGETVCALFVASLSHHGRPLQLESTRQRNPPIWQPHSCLHPENYVKRLGKLSRQWFPAAFHSDAPPLPSNPAFQHAFLGLCNWADWIGSDERRFSFIDRPCDDYIETARNRAREAVASIGLDISTQRRSFNDIPDFAALFEIEGAPNAIQNAIADTPLEERLVIIESETGSGKTEAALWRFAKMYRAGIVDGLYFALPTHTAAVQIHRRVENFIARLLPCRTPSTVLAVPGYHPDADASPVEISPYNEGAAGIAPEAVPWASEHPKRYLAAQIAVGTIDQALMGALQVKNAHMRAACLARNLLIVDEVHASDTYMSVVLEALLRAHLNSGGYALLMSATLGSAARHRFLDDRRGPTLSDAEKAPYPAVSSLGAGLTPAGENDRNKRVSITASPTMNDFPATARRALDAARQGAKVLVVRNTVGHAVGTQMALEGLASDGDSNILFAVKGQKTLHHGRFAACDRAILDRRVEQLLGKNRKSGGRVVVGTQTLEQSLDIDADLLITDLCPADVLLQRIGRLHRHGDNNRPRGYENPNCIVLTPPDNDLSPLLTDGKQANGLGPKGYVYRSLSVLEATLRLIKEFPHWRIPEMNRMLVERATHTDVLTDIVSEMGDDWTEAAIQHEGGEIADRQIARGHIIKRDKSFFTDNREVLFASVEENVRTRLGDDRVDVCFDPPPRSPFDNALAIEKLPVSVRWLDGSDVPESVTPTATAYGFTFAVGSRNFLYDRLGLRRE